MVFTLLAIIELVVDKLPNTPPRTAPVGLIARIVLGGASGLALATGAGTSMSLAGVIASLGAIAGAFAGYHIRRAVVFRAHLPGFVVAIAEDAIAIVGDSSSSRTSKQLVAPKSPFTSCSSGNHRRF